MKNVMFKTTPVPTPNKNAFDLSHEVKTSGQLGQIIPIMWYDVVPGDTFKIKNEVLVKFAPLLAPLLHRVDVYTHTFYVPYRMLMNMYSSTFGGWEDFITGDPEGIYSATQLPTVSMNNSTKSYFAPTSLACDFGLPAISAVGTVTQNVDIVAFPFMAYQLIYDDYYRDENLITRITAKQPNGSATIPLIGIDHTAAITDLMTTRKRSYEKDYLRGALPNAYFGSSSDVELDLDIISTGASIEIMKVGGGAPAAGALQFTASDYTLKDATPAQLAFLTGTQPISATLEVIELRRAQALTRYLEAENRGGHRYVEMLLGVWGVISDNLEIQVPKYLGGGRQAVQISSVLNQSQVLDPTAGVNDGVGGAVETIDPQSLETGRAMSSGVNNRATGSFKEHGIVMTLLSVLPRTAYGGANLEKYWRKTLREDFFVPQLQGLGDQAILQSEAGFDATGTDMDDIFGYAPPWSEYKFKNSLIGGDFLTTLDYWHLGDIGDASGAGPDLNQAFIECNFTDDKNLRIFANESSSDDHLYIQVYNDVKAIRPMLVHDIPK